MQRVLHGRVVEVVGEELPVAGLRLVPALGPGDLTQQPLVDEVGQLARMPGSPGRHDHGRVGGDGRDLLFEPAAGGAGQAVAQPGRLGGQPVVQRGRAGLVAAGRVAQVVPGGPGGPAITAGWPIGGVEAFGGGDQLQRGVRFADLQGAQDLLGEVLGGGVPGDPFVGAGFLAALEHRGVGGDGGGHGGVDCGEAVLVDQVAQVRLRGVSGGVGLVQVCRPAVVAGGVIGDGVADHGQMDLAQRPRVRHGRGHGRGWYGLCGDHGPVVGGQGGLLGDRGRPGALGQVIEVADPGQ